MSKKKDQGSCPFSDRLGKVGGQAVLEGVMMKAGDRMVTTCRKGDGTLVVTDSKYVSARQKYKILDLPLIRGVVSFVESMTMSFETMGASADALGLEEEEPSKFEKWLSKTFGVNITTVVMVVALLLGLGLSALLFVFLPIWLTAGINFLLDLTLGMKMPSALSAVLEGVVKVGIFVGYLAGVSLVPDIKRTFMYHGAEHKSIACFESGEELTPENAKKHTRFHPRCGTSFMFVMILLGIFAGLIIKTVIPGLNTFAYSLIRILVLPLLMGLGYEFIRFAGKHPNWFTKALSAPGLWMQRITTKEPDESMLEVAITSLKCSLRDDYPEFMEFYQAKPWEPEQAANESAEATEAAESTEGEKPSAETVEGAETTEGAGPSIEATEGAEATCEAEKNSEISESNGSTAVENDA